MSVKVMGGSTTIVGMSYQPVTKVCMASRGFDVRYVYPCLLPKANEVTNTLDAMRVSISRQIRHGVQNIEDINNNLNSILDRVPFSLWRILH